MNFKIKLIKMGLDYTGHYGIGVKLVSLDFESNEFNEFEKYEIGCMFEYLELLEEWLPDDSIFEIEYFSVGDPESDNDYYICIKDPFIHGIYSFMEKSRQFLEFLKLHNVKYEGEIDSVGGLRIR
jgi:hypothetical protein